MNKIVIRLSGYLFAFFPLTTISTLCYAQANGYELINKNATEKTNTLYQNLSNIKTMGVMFGHQDDLALGVNWKFEDGRSDIMEVCNDFPAVFGWDVENIGMQKENRDGISFDMMVNWIQLSYKSGGINTISWSMANPTADGTNPVASILSEGENHARFKMQLDAIANFANQLNIGKGDKKIIPIIFRPFHQGSCDSFWWSKENCSPEEFKSLWKFTVDYLTKEKGINNLIFAYSTDAFHSKTEFMEYYPGDEYVDIIGLNLYDTGSQDFALELSRKLLVLNEIGTGHGKVTAITETGYNQVPSTNWWTDQLAKGIFSNRATANISYVMIGKNLSSDHFYAPYPEHSSAENFLLLYQNMYTLFLEDIQDVYVTR